MFAIMKAHHAVYLCLQGSINRKSEPVTTEEIVYAEVINAVPNGGRVKIAGSKAETKNNKGTLV